MRKVTTAGAGSDVASSVRLMLVVLSVCSLGCEPPEPDSPEARFGTIGIIRSPGLNLANLTADPFRPIPRLDPDKLPPAADALLLVVEESEGRVDSVRQGFVFDADGKSAFVVTDAMGIGSNPEDGQGRLIRAQKTYRAVIGAGADVRSVPLTLVRRYIAPNTLVLSGPKDQLPPPLPDTKAGVLTAGQRLYIGGYVSAPTYDESESWGTRAAEPAEIAAESPQQAKYRLFGYPTSLAVAACAPESRIETGVALAADGMPLALAKRRLLSIKPGPLIPDWLVCYPLQNLRQFAGPQLIYFFADPRPTGDGVETKLVLQCIEPSGPLGKLWLLISEEPLELSPETRPQVVVAPTPTLFNMYGSRGPREPVVGDKWSRTPADLQIVSAKSIPNTAVFFANGWTSGRQATDPHPDASPQSWPHLATYHAEFRFAAKPKHGYGFVQVVYDDPAGKTYVLGFERAVYMKTFFNVR
jgi:hypothetical protein